MMRRIGAGTAVVCGVLALAAWGIWPRDGAVAAGVVGGGALVGLSAWAIHGGVEGLFGGGGRPRWVLVKIFTRHAILALAAYGMIVRLHLDPVGMLAGVTALVVAAGVEAARRVKQVS
jgi:hypothetical protein